MHGVDFLQDLAVVMIVAAIVTVIFHRLKQPVVLGYIIAGLIIGPYTPPFPLIQDKESIQTLADLGVVLLMFSLGLEFNLRKLKQVGWTAFIAAFLEILLMIWVGYEIGRLFGWKVMDSIFLGAILSISSTTIIIKGLTELGKTKAPFADLIFGILIVEDMLAIVMIALLSGIAMTGSLQANQIFETVARLGIFLVTALVLGLLAVPRLIAYVARFKSSEMLLVTVLGLCFGSALLAVKLGYSVALGAFVMGAVIAEAREIGRVEQLTGPLKDMFSAVFFVAIGLLIDPALLMKYALPIAIITLAVIGGKVFTCALGTFVAGYDTRTSLRVGMGLAQIGEFSFIIASLGLSLKVTSEFLYPIAVMVSAITTLTTPYLIKSSDRMVGWFDRVAPPWITNQLELYTHWVGRLRGARKRNLPARLIRKWVWQMLLNLALISAVFIGAAFVARLEATRLWGARLGPVGIKSILWLAAVLVTIPLFIATFRKLQALGMLLSELSVTQALAGPQTRNIRAIVAQIIPSVGVIGLGLLILVLSSTLLPPLEVLVMLLLVVLILTWLLWRSFVRIYSKAQVALMETFAQPANRREHVEPPPALQILKDAELETVPISEHSPAAGKLIRQLQLRTLTGASIVGIQRNSESLVNPGPDEEIQSGDQLLLIGQHGQLANARQLLNAEPSP